MANPKHFIVSSKSGAKRLVLAKGKSAALAHVIGSDYSCEVAKITDVVDMLGQGGKVEDATGAMATQKNPDVLL